ncbi:MAG: type II toxin-antitoxin system YafQ family toxin [Bacteroidales bacterium]|nr:type II toxin-antitoxin system YafQ family toxin [Bacteroidales bacterium]MBP5538171.1 type II toxin-antitoxin system YafQ family toxin [Bacteroidales bacterium]MBP5795758.1 type II toxin-antitoxin system YafQ family toxin [Bacteroidales bacterium]
MWEIVYSTRFKKDLKRYKGQPDRIKALKAVLQQLRDNGKVDASYKPHRLSGEYNDCMECHVQNDFLLIWIDESLHQIKLVRLGSHPDLFK